MYQNRKGSRKLSVHFCLSFLFLFPFILKKKMIISHFYFLFFFNTKFTLTSSSDQKSNINQILYTFCSAIIVSSSTSASANSIGYRFDIPPLNCELFTPFSSLRIRQCSPRWCDWIIRWTDADSCQAREFNASLMQQAGIVHSLSNIHFPISM